MTKVDLTFKLSRILNDDDLKQIARLHAVYGMILIRLAATGDQLFVQYDASRLTPKEVRGTLGQHGIAIAD
jgi:hypothetical protein